MTLFAFRDAICDPYFNTEQFAYDGGDCCGGTCNGPECGLGMSPVTFGIDSQAQNVDEFNILSFHNCKDPKMAPMTLELSNFELFEDNDEWNAIIGNEKGGSFCSTAVINVQCDGVTYLHFPQHILRGSDNCSRSYKETIHVPFGSRCELSANIACFGLFCLDHDIKIYYGNNTLSGPIRKGSLKNQSRLSFGVPLECLTEALSERFSIFDLSTDQGAAANALSNDGLSEFLCKEDRVDNRTIVLERFALAVFNASVHFRSSNWEPYQCHGWGIPAVKAECESFTVTSLVLERDAVSQIGTIPTELALLSGLSEFRLARTRVPCISLLY